MISLSKYKGCFLGLAIGDAYGAPYEGGILERMLWKIIGKTKDGRFRYTDDTQMSMDLANSFIQRREINQEDLSKAFAASYKWTRGYGPSAGKLLKKIRAGAIWYEVNRLKFKDGSLGNGAAMRAPIVAMCYPNNKSLLKENVTKASEITHAHPLAIEGAQLIAFVTSSVLNGMSADAIVKALPNQCDAEQYRSKVSHCLAFLEISNTLKINDIKTKLGNGIIATESCVTAIYFGLKYINENLDKMLNHIFDLGGDVDTIGAMAGAIWGAANGYDAVKTKKHSVEDSEMIIKIAERLYEASI